MNPHDKYYTELQKAQRYWLSYEQRKSATFLMIVLGVIVIISGFFN